MNLLAMAEYEMKTHIHQEHRRSRMRVKVGNRGYSSKDQPIMVELLGICGKIPWA
jgi:hypothetical protein